MIDLTELKRTALLLTAALTVVVLAGMPRVVPAQERTPPEKQPADASMVEPAQPPPIQPDRAYESDRRDALERYERFEYLDVPPGYTVRTWYQELAASDAYDRGYEQGFTRGWEAAQRALAEQQNNTLVASLLDDGDRHFRARHYGDAARSFLLAARQDQGDPVPRLRAAHALTALGHYEQAWLLVRRALQLEPRLFYLPVDIRQDYEDAAQFTRHRERLAGAAADADVDPELWALLGYYRFFSGAAENAVAALNRAALLAPKEPAIRKLRDVARLTVPARLSGHLPEQKRE